MAELASAFKTAQSNIEPSDDDWDNAPAAHDDIAKVLKADETLAEWGINPFLIGSYGRRVSIRRVLDVDMFCRLDEYPDGMTAEKVLDRVYEVLVAEYGKAAAKREDRSITVLVPDAEGLYVDVVPARAAGDVWEIPTKDGDWIGTNPIVMSDLKEDKNAEFDAMYVPCVKLVRQARRNMLGKMKPGGFALEMALFTACEEGLVTPTNSMADLFASALEGIADVLTRMVDEGFKMPDPSMQGETLEFEAGANFEEARDKFVTAAADARAAYHMEEVKAGKAALLLQGILGGNEDFEDVFPMPAGFDENGDSTSENRRKAGDLKPTPGPLRFG